MDCKAKIRGISRDWNTGKLILQILLEDAHPSELEWFTEDMDLRLRLSRWIQRRSLNANAYCFAILTEMALKLGTTKEALYERYIQDYAPVAQDEEGYIVITVKSHVDMGRIQGHWKRLKDSEDGKWTSYAMLTGSSEFDTETMAHFLDAIIEDAKELGIDTRTPDEIERLKSLWHGQQSQET